MSAGRLIAIGDIHGCSDALATVLEAVKPTRLDRLIFLGDYVDRGPDSRTVINQLIELRERCELVTLLGNHEEMMLRSLQGVAPVGSWLMVGGAETLASYGGRGTAGDLSVVPAEHREFLAACTEHHEEEDFFFVHANYVPSEPLDEQPAEALRWLSLADQFPQPHVSGRTAIVGHTAQKSGEVFDGDHVRCIDTFCHGGGWLTAMEVRSGQIWQADRTGQMRGG